MIKDRKWYPKLCFYYSKLWSVSNAQPGLKLILIKENVKSLLTKSDKISGEFSKPSYRKNTVLTSLAQ